MSTPATPFLTGYTITDGVAGAVAGINGQTWVVFGFSGPSFEVNGLSIPGNSSGKTLAAVLFDNEGTGVTAATIEAPSFDVNYIKLATDERGWLVLGFDLLAFPDTDVTMKSSGGYLAPINPNAVQVHLLSTDGVWSARTTLDLSVNFLSDYTFNLTHVAVTNGTGYALIEGYYPAPQITVYWWKVGATSAVPLSFTDTGLTNAGTPKIPQWLKAGSSTELEDVDSSITRYISANGLIAKNDSVFISLTIGWHGQDGHEEFVFQDPVSIFDIGGAPNDAFAGQASNYDYPLHFQKGWTVGTRIFMLNGETGALMGEVVPPEAAGEIQWTKHPMGFDAATSTLWVAAPTLQQTFTAVATVSGLAHINGGGGGVSALVKYKTADLQAGVATDIITYADSNVISIDPKAVDFVGSGNPVIIGSTNTTYGLGTPSVFGTSIPTGVSFIASASSANTSGSWTTTMSISMSGSTGVIAGTGLGTVTWDNSGHPQSVPEAVATEIFWIGSIDRTLEIGTFDGIGGAGSGTPTVGAYPTAPIGNIPPCYVGNTVLATLQTTDPNTTNLTWALSTTNDPTYSSPLSMLELGPNGAAGSISIDNAGHVAVTSSGLALGTFTFWVAINETGTQNWSAWRQFTVKITTPPGPSSPFVVGNGSTTDLPPISENSTVELDLEWDDATYTSGGSGRWDLEVGACTPSGSSFRVDLTNLISSSTYNPTTGGVVELQVPVTPSPEMDGAAFVTVLVSASTSGSKLRRHLSISPPSYFHGKFAIWARAVNRSTTNFPVLGATSILTGVVGYTPTTPSAPWPSTMPHGEPGDQAIVGTFVTSDQNASSPHDTFEIAALNSSSWDQSLSLDGIGTLGVSYPSNSTTASVTFSPSSGFRGSYAFQLRARNAVGAGPAITVRGIVSSTRLTAVLQTVDHLSGEVTPLTIVTEIAALSITETLGGSGQISLTAGAEEIARRAARLTDVVDSPLDLVEPAAIEVAIYLGDQCLAIGTISESTYATDTATYEVTAMGLLEALLAHAAIEFPARIGDNPGGGTGAPCIISYNAATGELELTNTGTAATLVDPNRLVYLNCFQADIAEDLLAREQAKPGGNLGLGFSNRTTGDHQVTVAFERNQLLSAAVKQITDQALGGLEVWVDPTTRELCVANTQGVNRIGELIFTERNSLGHQITAKWDDLSTVVRIEGGGIMNAAPNSSGQPTDPTTTYGEAVASTEALRKYGRHANPFSATSLTTDSALTELANEYLADQQTPLRTAAIIYDASKGRPFGVADFSVGDFASVEIDTHLGVVAWPCRITSRTISLVDSNSSSFQVTCQVEEVRLDGAGNPISREARTSHAPQLLSLVYDLLLKNK